MIRYKLLAVMLYVLVTLTKDFSFFKPETSISETKEINDNTFPEKVESTSSTRKVKKAKASKLRTVAASVYFPVPNQTDSTPYITADGSRINKQNPRKHRWLAISRDLHSRWGGHLSFGDSLVVSGISKEMDGLYVVRDVMNRRIRNQVDILVGKKDRIMGFWDDVQIAKL